MHITVPAGFCTGSPAVFVLAQAGNANMVAIRSEIVNESIGYRCSIESAAVACTFRLAKTTHQTIYQY
jgi:hypothetical protein